MSRYSNYVMKNNVFAELYAPISSLATTIQLKSGQGARRGTDFPILATLEAVESGKVIKREIVKITARSGDYLTVVRGFAPCPPNDDSNTQGSTTFSFGADDKINMYVPKEIFDKIGETLNDIYEKGLNKLRVDIVSGLEISVGAGPVLVGSSYYDFAGDTITLTDNSTNYVEIDEDGLLVNNTTSWTLENTKVAKITTSGGSITSIIDRRLATIGGKIGGLNIHELTEKSTLNIDDEFIVADSENIYQNKRVKMPNILNIKALTEKKRTSVNDLFIISDSEDGNVNKKISIGNAIPPTTLNRDTTTYKIGSTDDLDYFVLYYDSGIRVYNKNVRLGGATNAIITGNTNRPPKGAFIYEGYVYVLCTITQKISKCKLTDTFNVSANWTFTDYGTTESNYFIGMRDGFIFFANNGSTNNIRKYDLTMTLQDTISIPSISIAPNDNACITKEGFYIKQNGADNKYFIPNEGGSASLIGLEQYSLGGHGGFLYGAPNTAGIPYFFLH